MRIATLFLFLATLAGCQSSMTVIEAQRVETAAVASACRVWVQQSYSSSRDSGETVAEIRLNNAHRNAYCKEPIK